MLSKIGAMDSAEATELLTSTMNGYKLSVEETLEVVDKLSALDLEYATSSAEIATSLQYVASSADNAGVSLDQLMALITVGSETTRLNAETIGQAWRTLISRFTNVKLGKYVSEEGEDLNNVETILKQFGITLRDSSNEWRNLGEVIDEIGSKWDSFSSVEKSAIATQVAGVQRANIFIATMENYSKVVEATGVSQDAAGTAAQKYEHVMDSLDAKINQFIVTWEKLVNNLNQSGTFGAIVDFGTSILELVDNLNLIENSLMVIVPLLAFKGIEAGVDGFNRLVTEINQSANAMNNFKTASKVFDSATVSNLNGYTELIIKLKDAQSGLSEETVRYQGIQLKIDNTEKQRSKTIESILDSTKNLTNEELARVMAQQKVNKATATAVLQQRGMNQTLIESTLSAAGYTGGINGASVATTTFGASVKAATVNLLAMAKAWIASPAGMVTIAVGAIMLLKSAFDEMNVTLAEQKESFEEASQAYDSAKQELEDLNSELQTNKDRIEELENKDSLSYVEREELENLKEANRSLEIQKRLLEEIAQTKFEDKWYEAKKVVQQVNEELSEASQSVDLADAALGANAVKISVPVNLNELDTAIDEDNLSAVLSQYDAINNALEQATNGVRNFSDEELLAMEQGRARSKTYINEFILDLENMKAQIESDPVEMFGGAEQQQQKINEVETAIKALYDKLEPGKYQTVRLNDIFTDSDYTEVIGKFKQISTTAEMTEDEINELFQGTNVEEFINELEAIDGVTFDQIKSEFSAFLQSMDYGKTAIQAAAASIADIETAVAGAGDAFNSGMQGVIDTYTTLKSVTEEYNNAGYLSQQTLLDLREAGIDANQYLVEQNGQLVINKTALADQVTQLYEAKIATLENTQATIDSSIQYLDQAAKIRISELEQQQFNEVAATVASNIYTSFIPSIVNFAKSFLNLADSAKVAGENIGVVTGEDMTNSFQNDSVMKEIRKQQNALRLQRAEITKEIEITEQEMEDWADSGGDAVDSLIYDNSRYASSTASTADKVSDEFQEAYDEIQYMRDRGLISEEEYLNRLYALNEKYNKDNLALWRKYDLEIYKGRQQLLSDRKQSAKDRAQEAADRKKKAIDKRIEALRDELDALNERYEAEDKAFELQKAQDRYNAAIATKNTRVYTNEKGWVDITCPG